MGRIPLDLTARPGPARLQPLMVGDQQAKIAVAGAQAQRGQVIAQGIGQVGGAVLDIMRQRQESDMRADDAAYSSFAKTRIAQADLEASQAQNAQDIKSIYEKAGQDVSDYITGATNGSPNIRHWEHQSALQERLTGLEGMLGLKAMEAEQKFNERETKAKANYLMANAIDNADESALQNAVDMLTGYTTPEERKAMVAEGKQRIEEYRGKAEYEAFMSESQALQEMNDVGDLESPDYVDSLLELKDRVEASDIGSGRKAQALTTLNGRIHAERKRANNAFKKASDDVAVKLVSGDLEPDDLEKVKRDLGPVAYNAFTRATYQDVKKSAKAGNADAKEAMDQFNKMVEGTDSWGKTVDKLASMKNSYGDVMVAVANLYAGEIVESQSTITAYDTLWMEKKVSVDGNLKNFVNTLRYFVGNQTEGQGEFISKSMREFVKWKNSDGDESYADFRTRVFGEAARKEAAIAPSEFIIGNKQSSIPAVTTQQEYDALPSGTQYIHPDGSTRVKK